MGIYVDYSLRAECEEAELRERLEAVRRRCLDLPLKSVGDVLRVEPVYNSITTMLYESEGLTLPAAIAERVRQAEEDRDHRIRCLSFAPMMNPDLPEKEVARYYAPALELIARTDLWNREEIPEKLGQTTPFGFSPITSPAAASSSTSPVSFSGTATRCFSTPAKAPSRSTWRSPPSGR